MRHSSRKLCTFWIKKAYFSLGFPFLDWFAFFCFSFYSVPSQSFTQDYHERTIPRKENAVKFVLFVDVVSRNIQTDKGLARPPAHL